MTKLLKYLEKVLFFIFFPLFKQQSRTERGYVLIQFLKGVFGVSDSPAGPTDVQKINPCLFHMTMVYSKIKPMST